MARVQVSELCGDDVLHPLDRVSRNRSSVEVWRDRASHAADDLEDALVRLAADRERCVVQLELAGNQLAADLSDQISQRCPEFVDDFLVCQCKASAGVGDWVPVIICHLYVLS